MWQSLCEYITALGHLGWVVLIGIISGGAGLYLDISGRVGFPTWLWVVLLAICLVIVPFVAFHKVRVQRDKALAVEQSLVITPHTYAIGLSGMTGYPQKPASVYWLCLEVTVNPINKPIDTLDLLIGRETIPANDWRGKNVAAFNVYFNVTEWWMHGENQVELIAKVGGKSHSSGRIPIDFNAELWGNHRI